MTIEQVFKFAEHANREAQEMMEERDRAVTRAEIAEQTITMIAGALNPVPPCDKTSDVKPTRESILDAIKGWREAFAKQEQRMGQLRRGQTTQVPPLGHPRRN